MRAMRKSTTGVGGREREKHDQWGVYGFQVGLVGPVSSSIQCIHPVVWPFCLAPTFFWRPRCDRSPLNLSICLCGPFTVRPVAEKIYLCIWLTNYIYPLIYWSVYLSEVSFPS